MWRSKRRSADKGYHATDTLELADWLNIRTYIPEPKRRGKRNWRDVPEEKRRAVINNRRRTARRTEQAVATSAKRTGGKELRPCVRHRRCPAELAAWDREGSKALPDCRGGPQPGLDHAQGVRNRNTEGLAGRGRPCFFCLSCLASRLSRSTAIGASFRLSRHAVSLSYATAL